MIRIGPFNVTEFGAYTVTSVFKSNGLTDSLVCSILVASLSPPPPSVPNNEIVEDKITDTGIIEAITPLPLPSGELEKFDKDTATVPTWAKPPPSLLVPNNQDSVINFKDSVSDGDILIGVIAIGLSEVSKADINAMTLTILGACKTG